MLCCVSEHKASLSQPFNGKKTKSLPCPCRNIKSGASACTKEVIWVLCSRTWAIQIPLVIMYRSSTCQECTNVLCKVQFLLQPVPTVERKQSLHDDIWSWPDSRKKSVHILTASATASQLTVRLHATIIAIPYNLQLIYIIFEHGVKLMYQTLWCQDDD